MAKVTFIGGEAAGNVGEIRWPIGQAGKMEDLVLPLNKPVEVSDPHVLKKITAMAKEGKFFEVEGVKAETGAEEPEEAEADEPKEAKPNAPAPRPGIGPSRRLGR